jgi:hypothetical protein
MPFDALSAPDAPASALADVADADVRFMLDADAVPGLLPRLLQPFAKRGLLPDRMWSHRSGEVMHVEIAVAMPASWVSLVEGNLRQTVGVRDVVPVRASSVRAAA